MFRLIALGVILLALMAVIGTVIVKHDNKVKAAVVAVWKPILDQQKEATDTAVAAANQNYATIHLYSEQAQACSAGTADLEKAGKEAKAQAARDLAAKAGRIAQLLADLKRHQQQAGTPDPAGATCEQKLETIRNIWDGVAARRLRDFAPIDQGGNGSGAAAPAGANPGADTVRVTR